MEGRLLLVIFALILASGFFSLLEHALKTARIPRLQKEAKKYRRALAAVENPNGYFIRARIWICSLQTLSAVLAGIDAGRLLQTAERQSPSFRILVIICYAALLVIANLAAGSLLPRIIAARAPERIASAALPLFELLSLPLRPVLFLARIAGERLRPLLSMKTGAGMTEDELHHALLEGEKSGIVESSERTMVEGVFYLGDRPLGAFMTHRSEIQWLDVNAPLKATHAKAMEYRSQRCFPVAEGSLDEIIGAAYLEDIVLDYACEKPAGLKAIMKKAIFAPETMPALKAFESFKKGEANFLFVMDEYGGLAGMVSVRGLMEEIVGELAAPVREEEKMLQLEDGSWLADGGLSIDDAAERLSLPGLAHHGEYHTLAGFVLTLAGELPGDGDSFLYRGYRFTVLDMDANRIDKIGIKKEE